jgi:pyrroloquinoline quinone biosynthesis protein B
VKIRVLGAAAGGGVPQWNCACENCALVRAGSPRVAARTEDSVAVSRDGESWFILNASPSIHAQIQSFGPLWPRAGRGSPIAGIVLTNGDLDHCLGLFSLRESTPLVVYATDAVYRSLVDDNAVARTLQRFPGQLTHRRLELGKATALNLLTGGPSGLSVVAHAAPGKLPIHLSGAKEPSAEDNIALTVLEDGTSTVLAYATAIASLEGVRPWLDEATAVLFDGTFFRDDELIALGLGTSRARDMAHLTIGGPEGSLAQLKDLRALHKVYTHINNTNPILDRESAERRAVDAAGWVVATDGLEMTL